MLFLQIAWSVARNTPFTGAPDPVVYPLVLVNAGNVWDPATNRVNIRQTGFYFIHLGGGIRAGTNIGLRLYVGNTMRLALREYNTNRNGVDTTSRSGVLHLTSGSVVRVNSLNTGAHSDAGLQTIFIGFLLY